MPGFQPDIVDVHVDKLLTQISIGYTNPDYVAAQVAPIVIVEKESDIIPQYVQDFWFRDVARPIAPGEKAPRSGFTTLNTLKYAVIEHAIAKEIPDRLRQNTDAPYDLDADGAKWVAEMIQLRQEVDFAINKFKAGVWATDRVGTTDFTKWSDYGLSDPIVDLRKDRRTVWTKIGRAANTLLLGEFVMDVLIDHPLLVERVKYQGNDVSEDLLKRLLRLDKVIVAASMQATNLEGATLALADLFDDDALLLYLPKSIGRFQPSAIYTFVQRPFTGGDRMVTRRIRDDERMVDIIEGRTAYDQKVIDNRAGVFFSDAVD